MLILQVYCRTAALAAQLIALGVPALVSCAPSKPPDSSIKAFRNYDVEQAALFDDAFAPQIFGSRHDPSPAEENPRFEPRAASAEAIIRAKVVTVSREGSLSDGSAFSVTLQPLKVLIGSTDLQEVVLSVPTTSPVYSLLDGVGPSFLGRTLVLLVRRYAEQGKVKAHFRAEPDTPQVLSAIATARALQ